MRGSPSRASCCVSFPPGVPCTENDYKLWSPSDERGNECLLGHKTVFKRRTPHATCFNGEDFDRPVVVSNCSCTREDYEWLVLLRCPGPGLCLPQPAAWPTRLGHGLFPRQKKADHRKSGFMKHFLCARHVLPGLFHFVLNSYEMRERCHTLGKL